MWGFGKNEKYLQSLERLSQFVRETTQFVVDHNIQTQEDLHALVARLKQYKAESSACIEEIEWELHKSFFTSIERDDVLTLAIKMKKIISVIEESIALMDIYQVTRPTEQMLKFAQLINKCSIEIEKAIQLLARKKLIEIGVQARTIKEYESNCDNLLRVALKNLFALEKNPIKIIQYKEIYETLEEVSDRCLEVANTLETIIMKNA